MTASDYIAICSTVIALCALGATFWQTKHSKQHSLLSVRPLLCWHKIKTGASDGCFLTFTVKNLGLGPAVIHKRFFLLNGERLESEPDDTGLVELVTNKAVGDKFVVRVLRSGLPGAGTALPSESDFLIAEILLVGMNTNTTEAALRSLAELDFVVEYKSMYEERFTLSALHGNSAGWGISR